MFEEETRRALDYVERGVSVQIVGAAGSGRSTVARRITAELEEFGVQVFSFSGSRFLQGTPLAGIEALGLLDVRPRMRGPLVLADIFAERLSRRGPKVVVVDDVDLLDSESLAVLDMVHKRTERPLVVTTGIESVYADSAGPALGRWSGAQIRLGPLRYDQVSKLVAQELGAPPDVETSAHILMKSGGSPWLVAAITRTAMLSKLLILSDGRWSMTGRTLWNEHLKGPVQELLHGLGPDELTALHTMSLLGPRTIKSLRPIVEPDVLDKLERRELVAVVEDAQDDLRVDVCPPILVDYFRDHQVLASRRILADRITRELDSPFHPASSTVPGPVAGLMSDLRNEASAGTASARHFQEQLRVLEEEHYRLWQSEKSMSAAAAFLKFYWGGAIDPVRIEEIFSATETRAGGAAEHLFFTMTRALWAVARGDDLSEAVRILEEFSAGHQDWNAEVEAFVIFLNASFDRMPKDWEGILDKLTSRHPESGVLPVIRGILELYCFDAQAALLALDSAETYGLAAGMEPFVRGLALHVAGGADDALIHALKQRSAARRGLDQFGFVSNSYVAALALTQRGLSTESDYLMSSVFALGRPGFLVSFLHDAMLRIAGLRALAGSVGDTLTLGAQARKDVADIGPLPGTGKGVYELVSRQYQDPAEFDEKAVDLLDQTIDRGYITEAVYASLFLLTLFPGSDVLAKAQWLFRENGVTAHDQLFAIAEAAIRRDYQFLRILLDQYEPDADLHLIGMLLKNAAKRRVLEGDTSSAVTLQRSFSSFETRFPIPGRHLTLDTAGPVAQTLTSREMEIAALAGSRSNQEIAARLGISLRTVENHLSKAMKKTGTSGRHELRAFVVQSFRGKQAPGQ